MVTYWWHTEVNDDLLCLTIISPSYPHHIPIISPSYPHQSHVWSIWDLTVKHAGNWWKYDGVTLLGKLTETATEAHVEFAVWPIILMVMSIAMSVYQSVNMWITWRYNSNMIHMDEIENLHWISSGHTRACFQQLQLSALWYNGCTASYRGDSQSCPKLQDAAWGITDF